MIHHLAKKVQKKATGFAFGFAGDAGSPVGSMDSVQALVILSFKNVQHSFPRSMKLWHLVANPNEHNKVKNMILVFRNTLIQLR